MKTLLLIAALAFSCTGLVSADSGKIKSPLIVQEGAVATGIVEGSFSIAKSELKIKFAKLAMGQLHELSIDGVIRRSFVPSSKGTAEIKWSTPAKSGSSVLDFDARGKLIELRSQGNLLLSGVFSGESEAPKSSASESSDLKNFTGLPKSSAKSTFSLSSSGVKLWQLSAQGLGPAPVEIRLNGVVLATATPIKGKLALKFSSVPSSKTLLLEVDPRGGLVELYQQESLIFQGYVNSRAQGVNVASKKQFSLNLPSTGVDSNATAKAKYRVRENGRRDFSVEVENLSVGFYDLLVDSIVRGQIEVKSVNGNNEGEIEFSNGEDDGSKLLLDFNPELAVITIRDANATYFSGLFDSRLLSAPPLAQEPESDFREDLTFVASQPGAKAEARHRVDSQSRHRFSVELEDFTNPGDYVLFVGGLERAVITVDGAASDNKGEVEFRSVAEAGKILLTFDPRGQLLEIKDALGTVLISHLFGDGSADNSAGAQDGGKEFELPLNASAGVTGTASMRYRYDNSNDRDFKVKIRNLPLGSYDLKVNSVVVGSISVVTSGGQTEGEIEFESSPDSGDEKLDFAVNGQLVEITKGEVLYFSRTAP
jgi:hypothetical protein